MSALSKKYKINYKKRYTIPKNKKPRGRKSIKVYHNRVKRPTRKRKHYMGGDIKVPAINSIFPSGQAYQPNMDCLEKECDKKDDAGEMTTTCLNTLIVMNLFSQKLDDLDDSEKKTMDRIGNELTAEERNQVKDLTEKYLSNYVDSLFSRSIFSKNNVDLTLENTQKLKELLKVINQEYIDYLIDDSNLSDDIKEKIRASKEELNATAPPDNATAPPDNATAPTSATATATATAPAIIDNTAIEAEAAKKATDDAESERLRLEAERLRLEAEKKATEDAAAAKKATEDAAAAKKAADDAEAERVRVEASKKTAANELEVAKQTKENAINLANQTKETAVNLAKQTRIAAEEKAVQNRENAINNKKISDFMRINKYKTALTDAQRAENSAIAKAERAEKKAIANANKAEQNVIDAVNKKILNNP
jgi:hypothetical protein